MKLSNEKRKFYFQVVNTLFLISLMVSIFGMLVYFGNYKIKMAYLAVGTLFLYFLHKLRGYPFFIYDSDGETLNFTNKDFFLIFGDLKLKKSAEFPKRKLSSFKIKNNIWNKKLILHLQSKRSAHETKKQKFDITYLNGNEIRHLKKSLEKVITQNNKLTEDEYDAE